MVATMMFLACRVNEWEKNGKPQKDHIFSGIEWGPDGESVMNRPLDIKVRNPEKVSIRKPVKVQIDGFFVFQKSGAVQFEGAVI